MAPSCHSSTSSAVGRGVGCRAANSAQGLADPHPVGQGGVLELGTDAPPQLVAVRGRVETEHPHRPASARRSPWRISTVVVLPAPFVPRRPNSSPRSTVKSMPLTTSASP